MKQKETIEQTPKSRFTRTLAQAKSLGILIMRTSPVWVPIVRLVASVAIGDADANADASCPIPEQSRPVAMPKYSGDFSGDRAPERPQTFPIFPNTRR